jgi:hypothetical protein
MFNLIVAVVGFILKLLGRAPSTPEQLGQAKASAQSQENARVEVQDAARAGAAADAQRVRNDPHGGDVTLDPAAPINQSPDAHFRD